MARLIHRLESWSMFIAGVSVVLVMAIIFLDAGGRYILGRPLPWAFDVVTNYLLVAAAYFAVSPTFQRGDHVKIDFLRNRMSPRVAAAADALCSVLAAILFAAIAWGAAQHAVTAFVRKEFYPGWIMWPAWASYLPIPLGASLLSVRLLHHAATLLRLGADPYVDAQGDGGME